MRLPRMGQRRIALGVAAALAGGAAAVGVAAAGDDGAATPARAKKTLTAAVTREDLVETRVVDGTLRYAGSIAILTRRGGTLTRLAAEGSVVEPGEIVFEIDGRPVVLLRGSVPAYRAMSVGTQGADVKQLEKALRGLGYKGFTIDGEYTTATAAAVREWQEDLGIDKTGVVELGDVVFGRSPVRIGNHSAQVGAVLAPGAPVTAASSTSRVVIVDLEMDKQMLARKGATVTIELAGGTTTRGIVTKVGRVAKSSDSDGGGSGDSSDKTTIEVEIRLKGPAKAGALDEAPVAVRLESDRREDVLTGPVAALLALAEGGYGVSVVDSGGRTRIVAVKTGMYAGGRVQISGEGIREGVRVEVPAS